ncbi:MAG TPA: ABC transporter ATP-binding protein [Spirochaetota bacterium]|nr:ABC transporter ATP-binding protein [Spirochaetota bacterium]HPI88543.1 ABC transporter ATP-binding protein [Spirochaetota bacterium]HPR48023.1 ABC transporter ATP-binding protein [Spirochaetota bacterium]
MDNHKDVSIEVRGLVKSYRGSGEDALKGVDLLVRKGEFFGLLGPNAAGKTTMISIMCGLLSITRGDVYVSGIDIKKRPGAVRSLIGLVPQDIALYPALTIRENIEFFARMHGLEGKSLKENAGRALDTLQLGQHAGKKVAACSGGIKRRANLVAGMIHSPGLVFLDEPTVGVDVQSRNLIFEYVRELNAGGTTIIYTTHYMEEAEDLCSRVVIIDDGGVVCDGVPAALIAEKGCRDLGELFLSLTGKQLRE